MVTTKTPRSRTFIVETETLENGGVMVIIERRDGERRSYTFPQKQLLLFRALNVPAKDAVDFLLGEA
jgi:hypothetical protein